MWTNAEPPFIAMTCMAALVMWASESFTVAMILLGAAAVYCGVADRREKRERKGLPSAEDLDAVAAEVRARELTELRPMRFYPPTKSCSTTSTVRFAVECRCPTYPDNWGVCSTYEEGGNGRCVYCDHSPDCHAALRLKRAEVASSIFADRFPNGGAIIETERDLALLGESIGE